MRALIVSIYKKRDIRDYNKYGGISLLHAATKILEMIIDKQLRDVIERYG